jgi:DNA polymerase-1
LGWNIGLPPAEYFTPEHQGLDGLIREIRDTKEVAIDTETDGLNLHKCRPYYWSLSWAPRSGRERRITMPWNTLKYFKDSFNDYDKRWVLANAKFDCHMLENIGSPLKGILIDVAVMHALLYEEESHGLKDMARSLLGWKWTDFSDTFGSLRAKTCICGGTEASHNNKLGVCKATNCNNFIQSTPLHLLRKAEKENINLLVDYAANDAYGTWHVYKKLDEELQKEQTWSLYGDTYHRIKTMRDYFYQTEVPFTRCLYVCERNGMKVDKAYLEGLRPTILKELEEIRFNINSNANMLLNPKSPDQLIEYFCTRGGIRPRKLTSGGKSGKKKPSIDEKFLEYVADDRHGTAIGKTAALVLEHNKIQKQFGTYIEKMPGRLDQNDRVHMRLNQDVARTGRLSSSDPNMQNVTGGEKDRFKLRNAFISEPGCSLVVADYSALEMRLLAAGSQEQAMMDIFHRNWDIHMGNASLVFEIPYDDLVKAKKTDKLVKDGKLPTSEMTDYVLHCLKARGDAKTIGFGLNYGMKEKTLARRMGCSEEEAIAKITKYMETYPAVKRFFDSEAEMAEATGYAYTLLGRRRHLPDMRSPDNYTRFRAQRQSSNFPIQGTAAEVCKMAMIHLSEDYELRDKYGYRMCLQVHDEIVGECPDETVEICKSRTREWMEHPFPTDIGVPLTVEIGVAKAWGLAK